MGLVARDGVATTDKATAEQPLPGRGRGGAIIAGLMVTCVDIRKIELVLVGINISLAILPGVPIGSPWNAKLEHRDFFTKIRVAWR